MALMTFKPTSPGRRAMVRVSTTGLHKGGPLEALTEKKSKTGGRNNDIQFSLLAEGFNPL